MPLILQREQVLEVYAEAASRKWVLPAFNVENLTTAEAILDSAKNYSQTIGVEDLPIIIGITNNYSQRPQSVYYTHTRLWQVGMLLFLSDLAVLAGPESPYAKLRIMIHLDHIQWDDDKELLEWNMNKFSSIMFDASSLPFEQNIEKTAAFVAKNKNIIVIEGACDGISEASGTGKNILTTPDMAEKYYRETGVDIIVANLGTEHRATSSVLQYHGDLARKISERIGPNLCLHGTSSVSSEKLANLFNDGICKVNMWTALERDSTPVLFQKMIENAGKMVGSEKAKKMLEEGLIGIKTDIESSQSIKYFTTSFRNEIVFRQMQEIIEKYLSLFYT